MTTDRYVIYLKAFHYNINRAMRKKVYLFVILTEKKKAGKWVLLCCTVVGHN